MGGGGLVELARGALEGEGLEPAFLALLETALAPVWQQARARPHWPVVALPRLVASQLGAGAGEAEALAAACLLFFASADVLDDLQDGDLVGLAPARAVNVGVALAFGAQALAVRSARGEGRLAVSRAFAATAMAMGAGQDRDLRQRGVPDGRVREADYLACIAGKTGAAFALFAGVGAIALEAPEVASRLAGYGRALGSAQQLQSDLADALAPDGRDAPNQQLTLPVIRAWERLKPRERPLLLAAWAREPGAPPLAFLLERTGAAESCRARLGVLRLEALAALEGLPATLASELAAHTEAWLGSPGSPWPGG